MDTEAIHPFAAELDRHLAQAAGAGDPLERALAAMEAYKWSRETLLPQIATLRRAAIRELRAQGYSIREVANMIGVTDARISQITGA